MDYDEIIKIKTTIKNMYLRIKNKKKFYKHQKEKIRQLQLYLLGQTHIDFTRPGEKTEEQKKIMKKNLIKKIVLFLKYVLIYKGIEIDF